MRDFQVSKVYAWEDEVLYPKSRPLSENQIINLVDRTCSTNDTPPLRYVDVAPVRTSTAMYNANKKSLVLPPWSHNTHHVIHEVAHHITRHKTRGLAAAHGPEFVGWMIRIFARRHRLSIRELITSAKNAGIEVV